MLPAVRPEIVPVTLLVVFPVADEGEAVTKTVLLPIDAAEVA